MKKLLLSAASAVLAVGAVCAWAADYTTGNEGYQKNSARYVSQISLTDGTHTATYGDLQTDGASNVVFDKTADEAFVTTPGATVTFQATGNGIWMHPYLFIDWNGDGFDYDSSLTDAENYLDEDGYSIKEGCDLLHYVMWGTDGEDYATYVKPDGTGLNNSDERNWDYNTPFSFTIPENAGYGTYRVRFKIDWNSLNPNGGIIGDANTTNSIARNGGIIVDFMIKIQRPAVFPEGKWYQLLNQETSQGRSNTYLGYYPETEWEVVLPTTSGTCTKTMGTNEWICGAAPFTDEATDAQKDGQLWQFIGNEEGTKFCLVNKAYPDGAVSNEILNNANGQNPSRWGYVADRSANPELVEWFTISNFGTEEVPASNLVFENPVASGFNYLSLAASGQNFQIMRYNNNEASAKWTFIEYIEPGEEPEPEPEPDFYYTFGSYNRGGYLTSNGIGVALSHVAISTAALWGAFPVEGVENGYYFKNFATGKYMSAGGATSSNTPVIVYMLPNGVNDYGISLSSANPIVYRSCIDANNNNTNCGNWTPSATDWQGTTWVASIIDAVEGATGEYYLNAATLNNLISGLKTNITNYCNSVPGFYEDYAEALTSLEEMTPAEVYEQFNGDMDAISAYIDEMSTGADAAALALVTGLEGEYVTLYNVRRSESGNNPYLAYIDGETPAFNTVAESNNTTTVWQIVGLEDGNYTLRNVMSNTYFQPITAWNQTNLAPVEGVEEAGSFTFTTSGGYVQLFAGTFGTYDAYYCLNDGIQNLASWAKDHGSDWQLALTDYVDPNIASINNMVAQLNTKITNYCNSVPGFYEDYAEALTSLEEMTAQEVYEEFGGDMEAITAYIDEMSTGADAAALALVNDLGDKFVTLYNVRRGENDMDPYLAHIAGEGETADAHNTIATAENHAIWHVVDKGNGTFTLRNAIHNSYIQPISYWYQSNLTPVTNAEEAGTFTFETSDGYVQLKAGIHTEDEVDYPYYYCFDTNGNNLASWVKDHGSNWALALVNDPTTSIETVSADETEAAVSCFDILGRPVAVPTKGLYIIGGKKIVVK